MTRPLATPSSPFRCVLLVLCSLYLLPLTIPHFLPFVDFPAHVGEVAVVTHYHDDPDRWRLRDFYRLSGFGPYYLSQQLVRPLAAWLGADPAYRLLFAFCVLAIPALGAAIARRVGGNPWPALFLLPVLYGYPPFMGFVPFLLSLVALLAAFLAWEQVDEARPGARVAILGAGSALLCLLHSVTFLIWASAIFAFALLRVSRRDWLHRLATTGLALLPGFATLAVLWSTESDHLDLYSRQLWLPGLGQRLRALPEQLGLFWSERTGIILLAAMGTLEVGLLVGAWIGRSHGRPGVAGTIDHHRYLVLALACLGGALILPWNFFIAQRQPMLALLILPLGLGGAHLWRRPILCAATTALVALFGIFLCVEMRAFERESRGFAELIERIPPGASYRCQVSAPASGISGLQSYRHFCGHVLAERGGLNGFLFLGGGILYRPEFQMPGGMLYAWQDKGGNFDLDTYGDRFDYYLVKGDDLHRRYGSGPRADHFRELHTASGWRLYARISSFAQSAVATHPPLDYTLQMDATGGEIVNVSDGRRIPVACGALVGRADLGAMRGEAAEIAGWAGDVGQGQPAGTIVVFSRGRALLARPPGNELPDVVAATGKADLRWSGFHFWLPLGPGARTERPVLRIFALHGDSACELRYGPGYGLQP